MYAKWPELGAKFYKRLQSWCFPSTCRICGLAGREPLDLCDSCYNELIFNDYYCERCAIPLPVAQKGMICGQCLKTPPQFDRSISLLHYHPPASQLIQGLKFRQQLGNAELLANLLADRILAEARTLPEYLVPVPLHPSRLRQRGFNQSVLIARVLHKRLEIPVLTEHCQRNRNTVSQAMLSLKDRKRNMRGVFQLRKALPSKHVAIVDDVVTTANTVNELARVLRHAGVESIEVWSLARALV